MDLWRRASGPWGEEMLVGVSWDLMWLAIFLAAGFVAGHALWAWRRSRVADDAGPAGVELDEPSSELPARIARHTLPSRIFHWTMAASMIALLATAFVPVLGWQFPWLTIHWVSGVVLLGTVVFHVVHAAGRGRFREMMTLGLSEGWAMARRATSVKAPPSPKPGKYPFDHRLFHHAIVVAGLTAIGTGALMTFRVDTWFWEADPYFLLPDGAWSTVYVLHGLSGVALIFLTAAHVYFGLRPDKIWLTWGMIRGWIGRDRYLEHYDPAKWAVGEAHAAPEGDDG